MKKILFIISLFVFGCKSNTSSNLSLNNLFSDHMVLQQDTMVNIWGKAIKGSKISVNASWGEKAFTSTNESGDWLVQIQTPNL